MTEFYTLNDGTKIPKIGFGTYNEEFADNKAAILSAIECGYRFFDTASLCETERSLGDALTTYLKGFLYSWEDAEDLMIEAFATQDQNEQRERSGVMQDQNEQRERLIVTDRSFFKFFSILVRNFVMKRTLYV